MLCTPSSHIAVINSSAPTICVVKPIGYPATAPVTPGLAWVVLGSVIRLKWRSTAATRRRTVQDGPHQPGPPPQTGTGDTEGPKKATPDRKASEATRPVVRWDELREPSDEAPLPRCLNSPRRIVLPNIGNRLTVGHPIEHRKTGQGRPGPSMPTSAGDLNQLSGGTLPSRTQGVDGRHPIRRQPEIRPPQPPALPGDRRRPTPQQVQREGRRRARRQRPAQPPTTNEPARWQSQDAGCGGFPGHGRA